MYSKWTIIFFKIKKVFPVHLADQNSGKKDSILREQKYQRRTNSTIKTFLNAKKK
jgi:hypothetical protein